MVGVEVLDRHHCFNKAKNNNWVPVISPCIETRLTSSFSSCAPGNTRKLTKSSADFDGTIPFQTIHFFAFKFGCFLNSLEFHPVMKNLAGIKD